MGRSLLIKSGVIKSESWCYGDLLFVNCRPEKWKWWRVMTAWAAVAAVPAVPLKYSGGLIEHFLLRTPWIRNDDCSFLQKLDDELFLILRESKVLPHLNEVNKKTQRRNSQFRAPSQLTCWSACQKDDWTPKCFNSGKKKKGKSSRKKKPGSKSFPRCVNLGY